MLKLIGGINMHRRDVIKAAVLASLKALSKKYKAAKLP